MYVCYIRSTRSNSDLDEAVDYCDSLYLTLVSIYVYCYTLVNNKPYLKSFAFNHRLLYLMCLKSHLYKRFKTQTLRNINH